MKISRDDAPWLLLLICGLVIIVLIVTIALNSPQQKAEPIRSVELGGNTIDLTGASTMTFQQCTETRKSEDMIVTVQTITVTMWLNPK